MPSPFPGMDPFIESQVWEEFHHGLIAEIRAALTPQVIPRYVVRIEKHVYRDHSLDDLLHRVRPQAMLRDEEHRVAFLTVRESETREAVTAIELLSPENKRRGSAGRRQYLRHRDELLQSGANRVELDLLRGGERLPSVEFLPPADFFAVVSREPRRPKLHVCSWSLRQPLPSICIPLKRDDPDARLDLQAIFTSAYDRSRYDLTIDYDEPVEPRLRGADAQWVRQLLNAASPSARA